MTPKTATLEIPELMQFLRQQLHDLPDERKPGNNTKYQVEDAMMAAFSIFFTQSASFLEHQRLMKSNQWYEPWGKPRLLFRPKGRGIYPLSRITGLRLI